MEATLWGRLVNNSALDGRAWLLWGLDVDGESGLEDITPLPVACALGPDDGAMRLERWRHLNRLADSVATLRGGQLEVRYRARPGVADELAVLAAAEQECCAFATWTVAVVEDQAVLRVTAPPEHPKAVEPIAEMFGAATS